MFAPDRRKLSVIKTENFFIERNRFSKRKNLYKFQFSSILLSLLAKKKNALEQRKREKS